MVLARSLLEHEQAHAFGRVAARSLVAGAALAMLAGAPTACRQAADVRGIVQQVGKGVPGATVGLECPDGSNRVTTTSAGGEFRFEDIGGGLEDACLIQVKLPGAWVPTQSVATQCRRHDDATRLCTEARFTFEVP